MKPQRFNRSPTKIERQEVEKLYRHGPNNRICKRAHAIRLSAMDSTVTQIAEILGCNRQSIHNWFDLFEAQGYQGFYDKPRSGKNSVEFLGFLAELTHEYRDRHCILVLDNASYHTACIVQKFLDELSCRF